MDIKFLLPLLVVIIPFSLSFFYSYGYLLLSSSHFSFQFSSSFHIYVDGYVSFFSLWPLPFILCSFPGLFYVYAICFRKCFTFPRFLFLGRYPIFLFSVFIDHYLRWKIFPIITLPSLETEQPKTSKIYSILSYPLAFYNNKQSVKEFRFSAIK